MSETADFQPKLIYLARRHPALTREQFVGRWRQHGALGMSLPRWRNIAHYVHCDVLDDSCYDAIGLIWHRSPNHRAAHIADTSSRLEMESDERATFARPIVQDCLIAREYVQRAPPTARPSAAKVFVFADAIDASAAAQRHARIADLAYAPSVVLYNHALPPERGTAWGLRYASVEEYGFDDLPAAQRAVAMLRSDSQALCVLTNEVTLYPRV
jgi:hypothetical protein